MINLTQYLDVVITVKDFFLGSTRFCPCLALCTDCVCLVTSVVLTLCALLTEAFQVPLSMGFSRQEYWVGYIPSSRESFRPRDPTHVSCVFCITEADSLQLSHWGSPETPALTIKTRGFVSRKLKKQWHYFGAIYNRMQHKTDVSEGTG